MPWRWSQTEPTLDELLRDDAMLQAVRSAGSNPRSSAAGWRRWPLAWRPGRASRRAAARRHRRSPSG